MFDAQKVKASCIFWIQDFFANNGINCNAVVGISGGKDNSLCVEALGGKRVVGVLMPNGIQPDIYAAKTLVEHLGIRHYIVNIEDTVEGVTKNIPFDISRQSSINLPVKIRMATLDWVGYATYDGLCCVLCLLLNLS